MSIHLLMIIASAEGHGEYPAGQQHALLVFANTADLETAVASMPGILAKSGWKLVEVQKAKELAIEISSISDEVLRNAAEAALELGYGIVVYTSSLRLN